MTVQLQHHRFTVESYNEMVAHGILTSDDRVELLAGEIVEMSPIGTRHMACVDRLTRLFVVALADRAIVRVQGAVVLPPYSEPEPDLAILRPRDDFYANAHAVPRDIFLLIEVAESSLAVDRLLKAPLYAAAEIPEYWIVDVASSAVERYADPKNGTYATKQVLHAGDRLAPIAFPELNVLVRDLLP